MLRFRRPLFVLSVLFKLCSLFVRVLVLTEIEVLVQKHGSYFNQKQFFSMIKKHKCLTLSALARKYEHTQTIMYFGISLWGATLGHYLTISWLLLLFESISTFPQQLHRRIGGNKRDKALTERGTVSWRRGMKEEKRLTILPRLNSLNHEPGTSLGHEDILTCEINKRRQIILTVDIIRGIVFFCVNHTANVKTKACV